MRHYMIAIGYRNQILGTGYQVPVTTNLLSIFRLPACGKRLLFDKLENLQGSSQLLQCRRDLVLHQHGTHSADSFRDSLMLVVVRWAVDSSPSTWLQVPFVVLCLLPAFVAATPLSFLNFYSADGSDAAICTFCSGHLQLLRPLRHPSFLAQF